MVLIPWKEKRLLSQQDFLHIDSVVYCICDVGKVVNLLHSISSFMETYSVGLRSVGRWQWGNTYDMTGTSHAPSVAAPVVLRGRQWGRTRVSVWKDTRDSLINRVPIWSFKMVWILISKSGTRSVPVREIKLAKVLGEKSRGQFE